MNKEISFSSSFSFLVRHNLNTSKIKCRYFPSFLWLGYSPDLALSLGAGVPPHSHPLLLGLWFWFCACTTLASTTFFWFGRIGSDFFAATPAHPHFILRFLSTLFLHLAPHLGQPLRAFGGFHEGLHPLHSPSAPLTKLSPSHPHQKIL